MSNQNVHVALGPVEGMVRFPSGETKTIPDGWDFLPAGDAGVTRRVKQAGPSWTLERRHGRRMISLGIYAPRVHIEAARAHFEEVRGTTAYAKRRESDAARRAVKESSYRDEFRAAVLSFLDFSFTYRELAEAIADRVTDHATPVGSGTVARTQRISIERRAEAAVIAWMRHATTAYDTMRIERVKGRRREVRRQLAERSRSLLRDYRDGVPVDHTVCPLYRAITRDASRGDA